MCNRTGCSNSIAILVQVLDTVLGQTVYNWCIQYASLVMVALQVGINI
jgi:hypothetical protein